MQCLIYTGFNTSSASTIKGTKSGLEWAVIIILIIPSKVPRLLCNFANPSIPFLQMAAGTSKGGTICTRRVILGRDTVRRDTVVLRYCDTVVLWYCAVILWYCGTVILWYGARAISATPINQCHHPRHHCNALEQYNSHHPEGKVWCIARRGDETPLNNMFLKFFNYFISQKSFCQILSVCHTWS